MIFTIMFSILYGFLSLLLSFLAVGTSVLPATLPDAFVSSVSYIFGFLNVIGFVISLPALYTVLALALTIEGLVIVWHIVHWLIRKIPFLHIS